MSLSDSSGEDEQITILEAQRAKHSLPRKKRRLNNNRSQAQDSSSSDDDSSSSSPEQPSKLSDKENSLNQQNRTRKRPRPSTQPASRHRSNRNQFSSQSNQHLYKFGKHTFDFPINVNPGALVRLELVNFLCHSNFSIAFNPMVNIIYGQNGSGKSAIEAGISMALGVNAKQTGRGKRIEDVIKFGQQFAVIRLFLHNDGPEALPEYGSEICIERRLTRNSKGGKSDFYVLDGSTLKKKASGAKAVRVIINKLNLNADNPCVILKQTTAKEFLNSTKGADKFKFFMSASKLGNYEDSMNEARQQVNQAVMEQRQSKDSFSVIRDRYIECKKKYDMLINMQEQEKTVEFWKRAEKWMIYHSQCDGAEQYEDMVEDYELKIKSGNEQLKTKQHGFTTKMERVKGLISEIEMKTAEMDKYQQPINVLKKEMSVLDRKRGNASRSASSKQRFVDQANRRIRDNERQYRDCLNQIQNNEKAQNLASLQQKLTSSTASLDTLRHEKESLLDKIEPSIEMKDNEQKLNQFQSERTYKINQIRDTESDLRKVRGKRNRSELFRDFNCQRRNISVEQIRQEIKRHHRKFERPPIGPLGEYINITDTGDMAQNSQNIQIVQNALSSSLNVFLVSSTRDQETFRRIMRNRFKMTIGCIQYPYGNEMHNICANPFANYRLRDGEGDIIRVTDMFTIKDNNPWIYNAILTNSSPERVYAYGDSNGCRKLLSDLSSHQLRGVQYMLTNEPNALYRIAKRGATISGSMQKQQRPILQSDQSQMKQWYQRQLQQQQQELQTIEHNIVSVKQYVDMAKQTLREHKRRWNTVIRNIKTLENTIETLQHEKTQIEDEEDDNELQEALRELQNTIDDEKANIETLSAEIEPFRQTENALLNQIADTKTKLQTIEHQLKEAHHAVQMQNRQKEEMISKLKSDKYRMQKIPQKIKEYQEALVDAQQSLKQERNRIQKLQEEAQSLGEEVKEEDYPRNHRNRQFTVDTLKVNIKKFEAQIETWKTQDNNDPDDIVQRFESIKPKYLTHQQKVDNCNRNCDEMNRQLRARRKAYDAMKEQVKYQLSLEFRYIMRKQGHDGALKVDYEAKELDMQVHMSSHDGSTQVVNSKTLSGGERSFTQVALIMALQKFSGSPMCIYDEFDVFMDSVNRGNSIRILLHAALGDDEGNKSKNDKKKGASTERQYIFITPNDVSPIIAQGHKNEISIHKLNAPRK